jgi:hypothetical protein
MFCCAKRRTMRPWFPHDGGEGVDGQSVQVRIWTLSGQVKRDMNTPFAPTEPPQLAANARNVMYR